MDTPRNPTTTDTRSLAEARPREAGMALFIVMILVLILTIVIFQLDFTVKIEERVSKHRSGFLEMSYSLQAAARSGLQLLETDLLEDLGLVEDETEEDEDGGGNFGDFGQNGPGPNDQVNPDTGETETERYDLRHEEWALEVEDQINEVEILMRITDGEGRISLNHLFEYPQYPPDPDDPDADPEIPDPDPEDPEDLEEEPEWEPPTSEQKEDAELILSRLIQAIIATNEDNGFEYFDTPDPDLAARAIVDYVLTRVENENARLIRSLEPIRKLPEVTWELFEGPRPDPEEEEEDEFEDDDPFAQFGIEGAALPGFETSEDGLGVEAIPRRLGLKEFLTVHSSGKINLNTAPRQILVALTLSIEDFDEAMEIAEAIEFHLNSYQEEEEEDPSAPTPTETDEEGEEATEEFNQFTKFDDLSEVDETWTEGDATEDTIMDLLRRDLEPVSVFKSEFFDIRIEGERDQRKVSAVMGVVRKEHDIIVLSWQESIR